jgi:hypothetical protein
MKLKLIGDYDWVFLRNTMVDALERCGSEEELLQVIDALVQGIGDENMIQAQRKRLGIKQLTSKELREIKKDG